MCVYMCALTSSMYILQGSTLTYLFKSTCIPTLKLKKLTVPLNFCFQDSNSLSQVNQKDKNDQNYEPKIYATPPISVQHRFHSRSSRYHCAV